MISLLSDEQPVDILVHPDPDWATTSQVQIEVKSHGVRVSEGPSLPTMDWEAAYKIFATTLGVNEHQLFAMAKGLDRGRTLHFSMPHKVSDLEAVGFISRKSEPKAAFEVRN